MSIQSYEHLVAALRMNADLASVLALLEWDQETFLPTGAQESRTRQIGAIATLAHQQETAPAFLDLVDTLAARIDELPVDAQIDVREVKWRTDRRRALDSNLVRERSMLHADAKAVWISARQQNDFATLAPYLARIVELERCVAKCIAPDRSSYDVLLEEYEPGTSTALIEPIFASLRQGLIPIVEELRALPPARSDAAALRGCFPVAEQRHFNRRIAEMIGFDFSRGRLDEAAHPFSTTIGEDVRLTTRYDEADLRYALFSTIHETGHGLYEQGLVSEAFGTPRGTSCSLGVHESQSRLWENQVGRSEAFWRFILPLARECYPSLASKSLDSVVIAANEARPSFIRTESDEITYNLHIILRFELERALIDDDLRVTDLPGAWQEKMRSLLGVEPPSDREGVLQDVHWPGGSIGYFPTYTLGNIYAAQLVNAVESDVGPFDALVARGEFGLILGWLRKNIHSVGQRYRAADLIERTTGQPVSPGPLLAHLARKMAALRGDCSS